MQQGHKAESLPPSCEEWGSAYKNSGLTTAAVPVVGGVGQGVIDWIMAPTNSYVEISTPVPENVTIFRSRVFTKEIINASKVPAFKHSNQFLLAIGLTGRGSSLTPT